MREIQRGGYMECNEIRNLYFERSSGEHIILLENCTENNALTAMNEFMRDHNYAAPYIRSWEVNEQKWYDVGSHTEFFIWSKDT